MHRRRSRSRSPMSRNSESDNLLCLSIRNLPREWGFDKIKDFIRSRASDKMVSNGLRFVDVMKNKGESIARFNCHAAARKAMQDLNGLSVGNQNLVVRLCDSMPPPKEPHQQTHQYEQNNEPQSDEEFETYGLNLNYLQGLGIKPPLVNKIFINNLDPKITKTKLHDVFSMAGKITNLIIIKKDETSDKPKVSAKIEYDHPVEAVQAVSMFHNKELYEKRIMTRLDYLTTGPLIKPLPGGLKSVGPGLGCDGQPMSNVRLQVEIQSLKQELNRKLQLLASNSTDVPNTNLNTTSTANPMLSNMTLNNMNPFNHLNNQFSMNAMAQNANIPNTMQIWANLMNNPLALAMQAQNGSMNQNNDWKTVSQAASQVGVNQTSGMMGSMDPVSLMNQQALMSGQWNKEKNSQKRGFDDRDKVFTDDNMDLVDRSYRDDDDRNSEASDMVIFTNLPATVNTHALKCKMSEVGDVKFVEITGQGRAIVRFHNSRDGERCIKMFHQSRVDGQIINVNYF